MDNRTTAIQIATTLLATDIEALKHHLALKERDLRAYQDLCPHVGSVGYCSICRKRLSEL